MKHVIQFMARCMTTGFAGFGALKVVFIGACSDYPSGAEPRAFFIAAFVCLALDGFVELMSRILISGTSDDRL